MQVPSLSLLGLGIPINATIASLASDSVGSTRFWACAMAVPTSSIAATAVDFANRDMHIAFIPWSLCKLMAMSQPCLYRYVHQTSKRPLGYFPPSQPQEKCPAA